MSADALRLVLGGAGRLLRRYRQYLTHVVNCERCSGSELCAAGQTVRRRYLDVR
ncbi:hypothetical protein ACWGDX_03155 [Streptomyces sp. NPDC055025]